MTDAGLIGGSDADRESLLALHAAYLEANASFDWAALDGIWSGSDWATFFNLNGHTYVGRDHWIRCGSSMPASWRPAPGRPTTSAGPSATGWRRSGATARPGCAGSTRATGRARCTTGTSSRARRWCSGRKTASGGWSTSISPRRARMTGREGSTALTSGDRPRGPAQGGSAAAARPRPLRRRCPPRPHAARRLPPQPAPACRDRRHRPLGGAGRGRAGGAHRRRSALRRPGLRGPLLARRDPRRNPALPGAQAGALRGRGGGARGRRRSIPGGGSRGAGRDRLPPAGGGRRCRDGDGRRRPGAARILDRQYRRPLLLRARRCGGRARRRGAAHRPPDPLRAAGSAAAGDPRRGRRFRHARAAG